MAVIYKLKRKSYIVFSLYIVGDNMFIRSRRHGYILFGLVIVLMVLVSGLSVVCVADDPSSIAYANITSRFILWDNSEKMLDPLFNINLIYFNQTYNNTAWYKIRINQDIYNDTFQGFTTVQFNLNTTEVIQILEVEINNVSVLTATGIIITKGVSKSSVQTGLKEWLISLSPFEWSKKEWDIFYGIIIASLLSVLIAYRIVKRHRKYRGVKEIK